MLRVPQQHLQALQKLKKNLRIVDRKIEHRNLNKNQQKLRILRFVENQLVENLEEVARHQILRLGVALVFVQPQHPQQEVADFEKQVFVLLLDALAKKAEDDFEVELHFSNKNRAGVGKILDVDLLQFFVVEDFLDDFENQKIVGLDFFGA